MTTGAIGITVVFLVIGTLLGWYSRKTVAAHEDIKVAKGRLSGGRKTRWRSALLVLVIGVVVILATRDILHF